MKFRLAGLLVVFGVLVGCSTSVELVRKEGFVPFAPPQVLYVVPFETIMVPSQVSEVLFDRFIDQLNSDGQERGFEFIILKQGLEGIDKKWLADKDYLTGDLFAYVEDVGSTNTTIRTKSRVQLYQPGFPDPTLILNYPTEVFFENNYSSLNAERTKLAESISRAMASQVMAEITKK